MTGVSNESSLSQHLHLIEIPYGLIDGLSVVGICVCVSGEHPMQIDSAREG
ncbi:hypothetical protein QE331_gp115 [Pseudomonas phage 20Sep416]|uniref:Uncharacterized protein n=4 Tax=Pakpunavirus TaxID=1921407 RepID=A0AAE9KG21_9CAUD|nr:hypothetical protein QE325_gp193 [Pseudomonas phage pPA-3099-2aT.2]YP_010763639.1 hypothetical protein QE331_gp115 [Pseudomonas phage 20Sep416]YP_010765484.1 hypothetical protein QE348_gp188 [Pseudomonas phage vB_Paer_PsIn]YP_010765684.1 hypothetical protein QE349_gp191 [Pseudomonas phage vB_Paer_PsCh]UZO33247.1 hypothetical protein CBSLWZGG_CDS12 [Pseudomonas phage PseuPha1]UOL48022.1 hypothetical protein vBPaerPsCh_191c [Pseudomonas phage vB_Paer_PsCh]UOL48216.1 hypothetical protein vBPa